MFEKNIPMKKIILLFTLFFNFFSFSQENDLEKNDSTRLVIGTKVYKI